MRIESVKREVSGSAPLRGAVATIKATPKIFDMFENGTYANKPVAILRELAANGIDAHVAAGNPDRPVEVVLPTPLDPTCRIRDFGIGMSQLFILGDETTPSKFMAYTDGSTKDNDDGQIGGFGIGSKSPFSYVDAYTLRVVHDGVLSIYTMFKNEEGLPEVSLQAETTTDEPNGVEVSFPVQEEDIETFRAAAQDALQYFQPLPAVTNGTLNAPDYTYVGNGWAMRPEAGELGIIMGGVRYPAQASSMTYELRSDERVSPLLGYGLDLTLPIGACGVAMSREQLSYVPKTSASIKDKLEAVLDDVVQTFATLFDHCSTEWEAMALLEKEAGGVSTYRRNPRQQLLMANARYKGQSLETSFRVVPADFAAAGIKRADEVQSWLVEPLHGRRSSRCPSPAWQLLAETYGIKPGEIETVIFDDLPRSPKSKTIAKIKNFVEEQSQAKATLIVRGADPAQLTGVLRGPSTVVLTSSLPEPPKAAKKAAGTRPRVRMFTYNGGNDAYTHRPITNLTPSSSKEKAVKEILYANQPATGIMVEMSSFDLPLRLHEMVATGLLDWSELYFVNASDAPKIKDAFETVQDVFKKRLAAALALESDLPARLALQRSPSMTRFGATFRRIEGDRRYDDLPTAAKTRPFGRLFDAWRRYVAPITTSQQALAPFVEAKLPTGFDPQALANAFDLKQPEAAILIQKLDLDQPEQRAILFKFL